MQRTMCLISFERAKRRTANMRSRESSWSLILHCVQLRHGIGELAHIRDK
jgi:hypothetical protein